MRSSLKIGILLSALIHCGNNPHLHAQPPAVDASAPMVDTSVALKNQLQIDVLDVRVHSLKSLDSFRGRIEWQLSVSNRGSMPQVLSRNHFRLSCNSEVLKQTSSAVSTLLKEDIQLKPGEVKECWLAYDVAEASSAEPSLMLTYVNGDIRKILPLNRALRRLSKLSVTRTGPEDCLAIIELHRSMDLPAIWILSEEFLKLQKQGVDRVALDFHGTAEQVRSSHSIRSALRAWLISAQDGADTKGLPYQLQLKSPVQFQMLSVSETQGRWSRYSNRNSKKIFCENRKKAVARALKGAYNGITVAEALADLKNSEAGVRQVAIETHLDRLTLDQVQAIIVDASQRESDYQVQIAENLFRVAYPQISETLKELALNHDPNVSAAAIQSLVQSLSPNANTALQSLWEEHADDDDVRRRIVTTVLKTKDYRHIDLLAEFVDDSLKEYAGNVVESLGDKSDNKQAHHHRNKATSAHTQTIQNALLILDEQQHKIIDDVVRQRVLSLSSPEMQDVVIAYILRNPDSGDNDLVRRYIAQRLPAVPSDSGLTEEQSADLQRRYGPRGESRPQRISPTLLGAIRKYPSSAYTDRLMELSKSSSVSGSLRSNAFQVAIQCATDEQISSAIEQFDAMEGKTRLFLLNHLALTQHPAWVGLVERSLRSDQPAWKAVLQVLRTNGSLETTMLLVNRLDELRAAAESSQKEGAGFSDSDRRKISDLMRTLTTSTHPESRRIMNRCHRSSVKIISDFALKWIIGFHRANPTLALSENARKLRKQGKFDDALKAYSDLLETDPFYASGYVARASLRLRDGKTELAMADLKTAEELDPENSLVESMIALTHVRSGDIESGLKESERVLATIPPLVTSVRRDTIYNTACAYGRAIEIEADDNKRKIYMQRGIQLLEECVDGDQGFDDVAHALNDPDLNAFHDHKEWKPLLDAIRRNRENIEAKRGPQKK